MKTWKQLLLRHGFIAKELQNGTFDLTGEKAENVELLTHALVQVGSMFSEFENIFRITSTPPSEEAWIEALCVPGRGKTEYIRIPEEELPLTLLDSYMAGIVRQLNVSGIQTIACCDGHDRGEPVICFDRTESSERIAYVFQQLNLGIRMQGNNVVHIRAKKETLLDAAERVAAIHLTLYDDHYSADQNIFLHYLDETLSIYGPSKKEEEIRQYVCEAIKPYVDKLTVDAYGNIVCYKKYGRENTNGPVVLLNAHLDTVPVVKNRDIIKEGPIWSSTHGPLGADDRAGVSAILTLAKWLQNSNFNGTVHFVFTVEEEIGLHGAKNIFLPYLWQIDYAIVLDRRGKGDIVVRNAAMDFCPATYGALFEAVAKDEGLTGWHTTTGGSSDTVQWAKAGIPSVNLSIGYQNEHTDAEYVNVDHCFETIQLVKGVFRHIRSFRYRSQNAASAKATLTKKRTVLDSIDF